MAIKKIQIIPPGYTDILHPETDSTSVIMGGGNTLQVDMDAHTGSTSKHISDAERITWNAKADLSTTYTKTETDSRIQAVVGVAPVALDTLKELADALGSDANFAGTVTTNLGLKVDKITGKGLSTNDYTTIEQTKLAGIATGANLYVHPANHLASVITQDASNRFASDTEKATWNAKEPAITKLTAFNKNYETVATNIKINGVQSVGSADTIARGDHVHPVDTSRASTAVATTGVNGLMSSADKTKVDALFLITQGTVQPTSGFWFKEI
jgi:hypothetical protein